MTCKFAKKEKNSKNRAFKISNLEEDLGVIWTKIF